MLTIVLNILTEFGPIFLFIGTVDFIGFIPATTLFMVATVVAVFGEYVRHRRIASFPIIVAAVVLAFGAATVLFKNPNIFIFKDTVYNGTFAAVILGGLAMNKLVLKYVFNGLFDITDRGWRIVSLRWGVLFLLMTISNEIVRINFSELVWVRYKLAMLLLTMVFSVWQFYTARAERLPGANAWGLRVNSQK